MSVNPAAILRGHRLAVSDLNGRAIKHCGRPLAPLNAPIPAGKIVTITTVTSIGRQSLSGGVEHPSLKGWI